MAKNKDFFWQTQGLKTFCKAKSDWFEFDKIHLSFVQHEGKEKNCKQSLAIEGSLKIHGADGALFLSEMVLSGAAKKMARKSKEDAQAQNKNYAAPIFSSMGGTVASRNKDGKCVFRQFSLAPGMKSDYVIQMLQCEGEETSTGGIQRKKGAQTQSINVPLSAGDLCDFAQSIQIEWTAYRTSCMLDITPKNENSVPSSKSVNVEESNAVQTSVKSTQTPPEAKTPIVLIYDSNGIFNGGFPVAVQLTSAVEKVKDFTKALLNLESRLVANPEEFNNAMEIIKKGEAGKETIITYTGKKNPDKKCGLVVYVTNVE